MKRHLHIFWIRPSILGLLLLPALLALGTGSSSSALESSVEIGDMTPAENSVPTARARRITAITIDPRLEADLYLRAIPFGETIASVGARYELDPLLIASVAEAESSFRVDAVSPKGALGLMQVMPFHVDSGIEPFDPQSNLELGAALLADLATRFDGELHLTLAAYHAGPGAVDRYGGVPPYRSTQRYVERVLEIYLGHYSQLFGEG